MLSIIWALLIFLSVLFGILTSNIENVSNSINLGAKEAVSLSISILGMICFWSGIMEIAIKSKLSDKIAILIKPLLKLIFKTRDNQTLAYISSNFTANLLGLSNAATPMGLKASERIIDLSDKKDTPQDLIMLIIINCSSIQLIPTTVGAIRASYGANNPFDIIGAVILTSLCSVFSGVILAKLFQKFSR